MIHDRLVCGINKDCIQKRLLTEGDKLTLTKAISLAQSYETAVQDAISLLPKDVASQLVHRVQLPAQAYNGSKICYRCARTEHLPSACCFKKERCHACNKIGHIKRACKATSTSGRAPVKTVQLVTQNTNVSEYLLFTVTTSNIAPIMIAVKINDKEIHTELDTWTCKNPMPG